MSIASGTLLPILAACSAQALAGLILIIRRKGLGHVLTPTAVIGAALALENAGDRDLSSLVLTIGIFGHVALAVAVLVSERQEERNDQARQVIEELERAGYGHRPSLVEAFLATGLVAGIKAEMKLLAIRSESIRKRIGRAERRLSAIVGTNAIKALRAMLHGSISRIGRNPYPVLNKLPDPAARKHRPAAAAKPITAPAARPAAPVMRELPASLLPAATPFPAPRPTGETTIPVSPPINSRTLADEPVRAYRVVEQAILTSPDPNIEIVGLVVRRKAGQTSRAA